MVFIEVDLSHHKKIKIGKNFRPIENLNELNSCKLGILSSGSGETRNQLPNP